MLRTRFGLACLVAGVSLGLLACDAGQIGGTGGPATAWAGRER